MACFSPLLGYYSRERQANGKRRIVFDKSLGFADRPVALPCGQCVGCRLEYSRQWAVRCMHEASLYERNCFITLTYEDRYLPGLFFVSSSGTIVESEHKATGSLRKRDFQLFMKRLRKRYGAGVRFYGCGEYGERWLRPHYHAVLFNHDFEDKVFVEKTERGDLLFESASLNELWPSGSHKIGFFSFETAAYCARYVVKKVTGERAAEHYSIVDGATGEVLQREPEFPLMSRRPGVGAGWYDKYSRDVYPDDFVVVNGVKARPPRYYDNRFEVRDEDAAMRLRRRRVRRARKHVSNNTPERLKVRAMVARAKLRLKARNLEG